MRGKPLYPYAGIAIVGIAIMIVLSFVGVNQKDARLALEGEEPAQEETADSTSPTSLGEESYQNTCIGCHGGNFEGPMASLVGIGEKYSKEDIIAIIQEGGEEFGAPGMAAYPNVDAEAIAEYLLEATK